MFFFSNYYSTSNVYHQLISCKRFSSRSADFGVQMVLFRDELFYKSRDKGFRRDKKAHLVVNMFY